MREATEGIGHDAESEADTDAAYDEGLAGAISRPLNDLP